MIDMTFLLLIFFLVTTTFERPEGVLSSKMPQAGSAAPGPELPLSPIIVRLAKAGTKGEGYHILLENAKQDVANFNALSSLLVEIQHQEGFDAQTPVVIIPEAGIHWDHVVNCWNAAVRAKYKNIALGEK